MALEGDGTITRLRNKNQQFYIENAVATDPRNPFDPEDPFEVTVLPHAGLLLTPATDESDPDETVTLANVLDALGVPWRDAADGSGEPDPDTTRPDRTDSETTLIDPTTLTLCPPQTNERRN